MNDYGAYCEWLAGEGVGSGNPRDYEMTGDDLDAFYAEEQDRKRGETGECMGLPANEEDNDPDNADDPDYMVPRESYPNI